MNDGNGPCKAGDGTLIETWTDVDNWQNVVKVGPIEFRLSADFPQDSAALISALELVKEVIITPPDTTLLSDFYEGLL